MNKIVGKSSLREIGRGKEREISEFSKCPINYQYGHRAMVGRTTRTKE
jgi:hypothetical protein